MPEHSNIIKTEKIIIAVTLMDALMFTILEHTNCLMESIISTHISDEL